MLDLGCVALLSVESPRLPVRLVDVGPSSTHRAKLNSSLPEALGHILNVGAIVWHHLMRLRVQFSDLLSPLLIREIYNADLLSGVFRIHMRHVIERHKSAFVCPLDCLEDGELGRRFLHVKRWNGALVYHFRSDRLWCANRVKYFTFGFFVDDDSSVLF